MILHTFKTSIRSEVVLSECIHTTVGAEDTLHYTLHYTQMSLFLGVFGWELPFSPNK